MSNRRSALVVGLLLLGAAACGGESGDNADAGPSASTPTRSPERSSAQPENPETPSASPSPTGRPPFTYKISKVTRNQLRYSWREGCPVGLSGLRMITMTYWGFDKKAHEGQLVVNASVAEDIASVFKKLYDNRFPIRKMVPVDVYKGSDFDSIEADNTSAFNCRQATGSSNWSQHAYGYAVDLNPLENPYVNADGSNAHRNADAFVKRPLKKPGVINNNDATVKAFRAIDWGWGGVWSGAKDYQHFSRSGR